MPQTHLSLHYHLLFHTKNNKPIISPKWRERLHAFLGGCLKTTGGIPIAIGGTSDPAHLKVCGSIVITIPDVSRRVNFQCASGTKYGYADNFL